MTKVLLVNGVLTHDSGKTWFSSLLARSLISEGFKVGIYKPVAGHNAWTQYNTVVRSKELKLLVGADVLTYLDLGLVKVGELMIANPVDLLMAPLDVVKYMNSGALYKYAVDLLNQFKQIVLARITSCEHNTSEHFIISSNLSYLTDPLISDLKELSITLEARDISIDDLIKTLRSQQVEDEMNACLKKICEGVDVVIVESFNDAFTPYPSLLNHISQVISVSQGRAILFKDVISIKTVVKEMLMAVGDEGLKALNIIGRLTPSLVIDIPPSPDIKSMQGTSWETMIRSLIR